VLGRENRVFGDVDGGAHVDAPAPVLQLEMIIASKSHQRIKWSLDVYPDLAGKMEEKGET
jgi:hypothetical protein